MLVRRHFSHALKPDFRSAGLRAGSFFRAGPQATLIIARAFAFGSTLILTSWSKAFKKRTSRSIENPSRRPRSNAEILGCSDPKDFGRLHLSEAAFFD